MKTLCFISLQLEIISHECIHWVLQSLKKDEMTPTEKAVQSRIKEAFAFKIPSSLWEFILEDLESTDQKSSSQHKPKSIKSGSFHKGRQGSGSYSYNTYNEYYSQSKDYKEYYIQNKFVEVEKKNQIPPNFKIREIEEDASIG